MKPPIIRNHCGIIVTFNFIINYMLLFICKYSKGAFFSFFLILYLNLIRRKNCKQLKFIYYYTTKPMLINSAHVSNVSYGYGYKHKDYIA